MVSTAITAFVSFASTNIDDIFVLMLFFSQINNDMKRRHIVIGQYLGIGVLTTLSIIGALGVSVIPHEYVGLFALAPIYLGIKAYVDHKKKIWIMEIQIIKNFRTVRIVDLRKQPKLKETV